MGKSFKEIEHKFIVRSGFDRGQFFEAIAKLSPAQTSEVMVEDTYYVLNDMPQHVFRHRFDREGQQLTVKSIEESPLVRTEINLNLDNSEASQAEAVGAFLSCFGLRWQHRLTKDVAVAYFSDCEIVHYRAECGERRVECVEFEAVGAETLEEAVPVLLRYEKALGFDGAAAEDRTLFELLLLADAPRDVVNMFRKKTDLK